MDSVSHEFPTKLATYASISYNSKAAIREGNVPWRIQVVWGKHLLCLAGREVFLLSSRKRVIPARFHDQVLITLGGICG